MGNRESMNIIMELENDKGLLVFRTNDDIPVYMMAKEYLLFEIVMPHIMDIKITSNDRRLGVPAFLFMAKALVHNTIHRRKIRDSKIVFYTVSRPTIIEGKYINRYTDFFATVYKGISGTIEQTAMDWTWPFPRHNGSVIFDGFGTALSRVKGNLNYKEDLEVVRSFVKYFSERVENVVGLKFDFEKCEEISVHIAKGIAEMRYKTKWLERNIPKSTKLVIMVGGCYPSYYPINRMLKSRGIITADIQHGFVTRTNHAYSYAESLRNEPDVKLGIADFFLTYGEWWNEQMLNPSQKIAIGNPYREYCISHLNLQPNRKRILIIGCEVSTNKYIEMTRTLSQSLPDYDVVFRPHPGEILEANRLLAEKNYKIKMDHEKEIYKSLEMTSVVISEISTVLYEAIGICDKIIVLDTDYSRTRMPDHPFAKCKTLEDIMDIVRNNSDLSNEYDQNVWAKNAKRNYKSFIENCGIYKNINSQD